MYIIKPFLIPDRTLSPFGVGVLECNSVSVIPLSSIPPSKKVSYFIGFFGMGVFQSVGGAATSGRGFTGQQVAEALRASAEAQRQRHQTRMAEGNHGAASKHKRSRSTVVQSLDDIGEACYTQSVEVRTKAPREKDSAEEVDVIVTEYAPEVFRYLRQLEGVQEAQFCDEWCLPKERLDLELGEGRSMAMFLKSKSMEFMCKTISDVEVAVMLGVLQNYTKHLSNNRHSLLMRFLMLLKVEVLGEVGYILCFADIFAGCDMLNERWDIKGRRPKPGKYRHFPKFAEKQNKEVEESCKRFNSLDHVDHKKLVTRKDKDLTRLFWLEEYARQDLLSQLHDDFQFLRSCGLMDYSILVGVKYSGQSTCSAGRSMRMTFALGEENQRGVREMRSREASPEMVTHYDPATITHNSKYHYGIQSLKGHETYYIGIIDMLTVYNMKKKTANFFKTFLWTEATLSTIPPEDYEERIEKYAKRIFASHEGGGDLANTQIYKSSP